MRLLSRAVILTGVIACAPLQAQEYDYFAANRDLIRNGVQAVLTCNGLFTSGRSIEQVFGQELAYVRESSKLRGGVLGSAEGGPYAKGLL